MNNTIDHIDWEDVRRRAGALSGQFSEEAMTRHRDWQDWLVEELQDLATSPYRKDAPICDDDIVDMAGLIGLRQFGFRVRLGNVVTGQEITFPDTVTAHTEDEAGVIALRRFRTEPAYSTLRGSDPAAWAIYGID
jgi:hypothetical protein